MRTACPPKPLLQLFLSACLILSALPLGAAHLYPVRPVRFIIPFPPGGGNGGFMPDDGSPQEFAARVKSELARLRELVQSAGIKE